MPISYTDVSRYAPVFVIKIKRKTLVADVSKLVSEVTITKEIRKPDRFTFNVQDEMKNGELQWIGDPIFRAGNEVSIELGYSEILVHRVKGIIEDVSGRFSTSVASSFTVSGVDRAYRKISSNSKPVIWLKKTDSDIVREIASQVGLVAEVDRTSIKFEEKKKKGDTSYFHFIDSLASNNAGFEFMVSDGKLFFRKAKITASEVLTVNWGVEIKEFTPNMNLSKMVTEVQVKSWDQKNKKMILGTAKTGAETNQEGDNDLGTLKAKKAYGDIVQVINEIPVSTVAEANEIAMAKLSEAGNQFIKVNIKSIGLPEVKPGVCVEVKGVGKDFEGKYYIEKSVHTISNSGYITTFDGRRNSIRKEKFEK